MPRKSRPRKSVDTLKNELWIAPRPPNTPTPKTFEPAACERVSRYLEFADIALGAKRIEPDTRKAAHGADGRHEKKLERKAAPISGVRHPPRFGAFRNSR
jgi:hypothetical protein